MSKAPFILIDLSFFPLLEDECYPIFFIPFMSLSKSIMFRQSFSLELYIFSLNISETWLIYNCVSSSLLQKEHMVYF